MPERASAVELPTGGSGFRIQPCGDSRRPSTPTPPSLGPTLGLTFSGGGFRATLATLGTVRYLADAGLLDQVRYVSSVSGGSITNGLLARHWPQLRGGGFTVKDVDALIVDPVQKLISGRSFKWTLLANVWRAALAPNRTDLLAREMDHWFFGGQRLSNLDAQVRWVFSAANIVTGVRFGFERDVVGDYVGGLAATTTTDLRVSQAVAASAAVPGIFAAWELRDVRFPCARSNPVLMDGGVYDNTGLEALDGDHYRNIFTVSMNAGGLLRVGAYGRVPILRDLYRANSLLYRQSTALRTRAMVQSFERGRRVPAGQPLPEGARRGILVGLGSDMPTAAVGRLGTFRECFEEARTWRGNDLALVPTAFDRLDAALCQRLIYRGWWLTGAALAAYHPELAPEPAVLTPPPLPPDRT